MILTAFNLCSGVLSADDTIFLITSSSSCSLGRQVISISLIIGGRVFIPDEHKDNNNDYTDLKPITPITVIFTTNMKDLTWKTLSSTYEHTGPWATLRRDRCEMPDGRIKDPYYVLEYPNWSNAVAITEEGKILLVRQYRHAAEIVSLELPGGVIEKDEDPKDGIKRELLEETGYTAGEWTHLTTIHPLIAYSDERIEVYLARGLSKGERKLDPGEFLDVLEVEPTQAMAWLREGKVSDPKTVIGLFWLEKLNNGQWKQGGA